MLPGPYDPQAPQEQQSLPWTCSCRTAYWMLKSLGGPQSIEEIASEMVGLGLVTSEYGLMDGSGAGLANYLASKSGYPTGSRYPVSWGELADLGIGQQPHGMGGGGWYHWVGVRQWRSGALHLANSAGGYMGVDQLLDQSDFARLGPFAVVWIESAGQEDELSAEEREELEAYRQNQPYYDTALGTPESPGGMVGQALGTMEETCLTAASTEGAADTTLALANTVLGQCKGLREGLGI